jgi:hypothetical protein
MTRRVAAVAVVVVLLSGCAGSGDRAAEEPSRSGAGASDTGAGETRSAGRAATTSATTRPTDVAAAPGAPAGWEVVPTGTYAAKQARGEVVITATGENPTAGFETKLMQSMLRIWPPQYVLVRRKAAGAQVAQVVTPFEVSASFRAAEPVNTVVVRDGMGRHEVKVEQ